MWEIENKTPFKAEAGFQRTMEGKELWIVVIKACFDIQPAGRLDISENQQEIFHAPVYNFEPGSSSVKYDSDFVIKKPATDVILNGQAWSEKGRVTRLEAAMQVGSVNKELVVTGDRTWRGDILNTKSLIMPFKSMPIVYERTYGGTDTTHKNTKKHQSFPANPVGTGFALKASGLRGKKVPNIRYKNRRFLKKNSPAGFGIISRYWEPRISFGGTYDDKWKKERKPFLPEDYDLKYNQQTPEDQQVKGYIKGGEPVLLKNLHPDGTLSFNIPGIDVLCKTRLDGAYIKQNPDIYTIIIEPDENRLIMVWHTALECHKKDHLIEKTIIEYLKR